jgi:hypothetical protein
MATVQGSPSGPQADDIEVIELTSAEYRSAVKAALGELGLTYGQLRAQARRGHFTSIRACKLWLMIGEPGSGR